MSNNVYSPDKKYTWGPEDHFTLTGNEFGLILNSLRAVLGTPEASNCLCSLAFFSSFLISLDGFLQYNQFLYL